MKITKISILLAAVIALGAAVASCSSTKTDNNMSENNALEVLKTRRAVRAYQDKMPEKELIDQILEAGTYAPTGMGKQSPVIVAVTNKDVRDRLSKLNADIMGRDTDPFYGAPVVLVVLADKQYPTYLYDGSLVMGNLMNAAHALGLGSCWIHRAKEVFETPEGKELLALSPSPNPPQENPTTSTTSTEQQHYFPQQSRKFSVPALLRKGRDSFSAALRKRCAITNPRLLISPFFP